MNWWIWGSALLAYAGFRLWYDSWRGPVTKAEIDEFFRNMEGTPSAEVNDMAVLRQFLEKDDGREFFMLNLVKFQAGEVPHPVTGKPSSGVAMMQQYMKTFVPSLLARAGHPAMAARKIGGYIDSWNCAPDPGWTIVGYMRYRSRRDMMALVAGPVFHEMHPFKIAGTAETFSFPTHPVVALVGPRIWVGLAILLVASFAQIAVLLAR